MAEERGYSRQVMPQAAEPMPLASPASFGSELAAQVAQVGQQIHQRDIAAYREERRRGAEEEWSGFQRGFAEARVLIGDTARERRRNGGAGHTEAIAEDWTKLGESLLGSITDQGVRDRAQASIANYSASLLEREGSWEDLRRVENALLDWADYEQVASNNVRRLDNHDDYLNEVSIGYDALEALELDDPAYRQARSAFDRTMAVSFLRGRIEDDPALAQAMLQEGLFDDALEPGDITTLLNSSDVELRALEVAARREAAAQRSLVIETARTAISRQGNGNPLTDEEWQAIEAQVAATDDMSALEDVRQARSEAGFARIYRGPEPMPPSMWEQRIAELAGMGTRSETQNRELEWLRNNVDSVRSTFERDPAGFLLQAGGAPQIDWQDPASLAARAEWARAQSAANGRHVAPISDIEAAPLRDLYDQDKVEDVLAALDGFADPFVRIDAAQVVAPEDRLLHRMAVLPTRYRARMRRGQIALRERPELLRVDEFSDAGEARALAEQRLRRALVEIDQADVEAVVQASDYLLVGTLESTGTTIDDVTPTALSRIQLAALGGVIRDGVQYGGVGLWPGDHAFIIPENMTRRDFSRAVGADFSRQQAAGTAPVNPDGSALEVGDLNRAYPVWLGGNFYRWETARGNSLRNAEGGLYITEVSR